MEITPGRAMYSPDEELKPLRLPKTYHAEPAAAPSTLSINAAEFVPRFTNVMTSSLQERLQKHQKQYLEKNYKIYQEPNEQDQQQLYQQPQQHPYSNAYGHQQQQQIHQHYPQSSQNLNSQMGSMSISSSNVPDRLRTTAFNGAGRGGRGVGGSTYFQQQQQHQNQNQFRYNKNHHQQQQHHHNSHQHRYNSHQNQQQQQQQYHHIQNQQQQSNASDAAESVNDVNSMALDFLQSVIQCLNQNPGEFNDIEKRFKTIFEGMESNHYVLSIAMEDIFDESIKNPNFRYMGAKLYNLLYMLNPSEDSLFHTLLKCKLEFHQKEVRELVQKKTEAKVREIALFLAELYMQLRDDNSRIYLIAENIVFSLKELLSMEDNKENIRCICLTLKLAGYDLTIDCSADMMEIIAKLDAINCQNHDKYPLVNNVISLQKNNWGRKPYSSAPKLIPLAMVFPKNLRPTDPIDPVFYGPDGNEITAEECEFLTNVAAGTAASSDNEDLDLDPEMDEETERDFKLFLKQSNNNS